MQDATDKLPSARSTMSAPVPTRGVQVVKFDQLPDQPNVEPHLFSFCCDSKLPLEDEEERRKKKEEMEGNAVAQSI